MPMYTFVYVCISYIDCLLIGSSWAVQCCAVLYSAAVLCKAVPCCALRGPPVERGAIHQITNGRR